MVRVPPLGLPDDPLAALNVLRWAAGLELLQSDDVKREPIGQR
ncbi:MAG TPA: hypothetical protein VN306_15520 [Mycobacterium sp.]|nr:hypothetical protein [Mycobacterium sp.]